MSREDNRRVLGKFAAMYDHYEANWKMRDPAWILAGTIGLTLGDLREAKQTLLHPEPEPVDRFIAAYMDWALEPLDVGEKLPWED